MTLVKRFLGLLVGVLAGVAISQILSHYAICHAVEPEDGDFV